MIETLEARRLLTTTPGNIDTSFAAGGIATINASNLDSAKEVVVQDDGRIVVAGWTAPGRTGPLAYLADSITLIRLNADGSLDSTFGVGGKAKFTISRPFSLGEPLPLVLLDDGSFLVGGDGVRKVSSTGQLLDSFGDDRVDSIAVDSNGTIITLTNVFHFNRYNADGTADTTFSGDGFVSLHEGFTFTSAGWAESREVAIQDDGKVVAAGVLNEGNGTYKIALTRLNADGTPDTSFGTGGYVLSGKTGDQVEGWSLAISPEGKLIVAAGGDGDVVLASFLASDGSPDPDFGGGDGIVSTPAPSGATITYDMLRDDDGTLYLATNAGMTIQRFKPDGAADGVFTVTVGSGAVSGFQSAHGVALQSDGKIVGVGHVQMGEVIGSEDIFESASDFYVFRLTPDGSDTPPPDTEPAPDVELTSDGHLLVTNLGAEDDTITLDVNNGQARLNRNGTVTTYPLADVKHFVIDAGQGDNSVICSIDVSTEITTGNGSDTITTAGGNDLIFCGDGADSINAGDGADGIIATTSGEVDAGIGPTILAGDGNDRIQAGFAVAIDGGAGNDIVTVEVADEINGGDGDDHITAINFAGLINAGAGEDTVRCNSDAEHPASIIGGDGRDIISTGDGRDSIYCGAGSDNVHAGNGSDLISGGGGHDDLFGQGGGDRIYGGAATDQLRGQGGNDRLDGAGGEADIVYGGPGDDLFLTADIVIDQVFGDAGNDSATADDDDALTGIEAIL